MKGSLLFSLLMAAFSCGVAAQKTKCDKADIVFLVDGSKSIGLPNFRIIRSFVKAIIGGFDIGPNKVQFGLAQYSDTPHPEFLLKDHAGNESMLAAVEKMPWRRGKTNTGEALKFLRTNYFTKEAGSRAEQKVPQIALVITDGDSNDDVIMPAERLRKHGVTIFCIAVGNLLNKKHLENIASLPPERFMLDVNSFQTLERLNDLLLGKVCDSVENQRQAEAESFRDIFFLVDSSIVPGEFSKFQSEITEWVTEKDIESSKNRLGLAQYSENPKVAFFLNAFQTKQQTLDGVKSFKLDPPSGKPSNLGNAIEQATAQYFTPEVGGRAHLGYPKSLVIVLKEKPDDSVSWPLRRTAMDGVDVYGIAAGATQDILDLIVTGRRGYPGPGWSKVPGFILPREMIVISEDCKGAKVADIVFIVAESTSIGITNYRLIRKFLHSVVGSLDIGQNRVRVGIVTYGDNATAQIYLDTFNVKADVLQFIKTMSYNGGDRNTGAALRFTREKLLDEQRGRRKGAQQVAVVITDGQSDDNVSEEAAALRRAGVTVYAVGIANATKSELSEMVSHPPYKHVFNVESFSKLRPLQQTLQKTMCYNIIHQAIAVNTSNKDVKGACVQKDEADFFFLMDDSGSIENQDFDDMKKFIIEFLRAFRIGPKYNRMGLVKYADSPRLQFDLDTHSNAEDIEEAVKKIIHEGGGTNTGKALSFMKKQCKKAVQSRRHEVPVYLIVITDGKSADKVKAPAEDLRAQGVITFVIGVKKANRAELLDIAGSPERTFFVGNFDALKLINKDIFTGICTPDACKDSTSDIFFLTDSSARISAKEYQTMKNFMKSVISKSNIGQNQVHVGVMQFSTSTELVFSLNSFYSQEEMSKAIDDMQQMSDGTHTGRAIAEVSKHFQQFRGGRPETRQSLILITNNKAIDEVIGPVAALKDKGVVVYAIGVVDANVGQLLEISGSSDRVFNERNFEALKNLENQVALKLCDPKDDCKKTERADIIFLIDVSTTIDKTEFGSMQIFMESVVNQSTVGTNRTRFGVIAYSTNPKSIFTLKEYNSRREVREAIGKVVPTGGDTYTGRALTYSLQFFNAEHGGRKKSKVPQILMVITDGDATNPHNLKIPSDTLRDNGVTVFSIGVKDANRAQLNTIAGGDKSKVFYVDNFKALEPLYKNISGVLCEYVKPVCEKEKADLVFLLDQSSSISNENYNIQKNFTIDLIKSFEISKEYVHVGLAQFSDVPQHEFYLNTYSKLEDMISHIRHMERFGVETYLGRALVFIKDYFKASHGSRSGLAKNLIVISDGDSDDDVEDAGEDLRVLGVEVFAVGVGDVHSLELLQITGTPERLFNARNFKGLENIKKKIIDRLCTPEPPLDPPGCSIDIAVGFDISRTSGAPGEKLISGQLQTLLPEIVHYLSSVQGLCCLSPTLVQTSMAFQVFDSSGRPLYSTNFESYSEDVVRKVMDLQMSEPTYFNAAMLEASRQRFNTSGAGVKVLLIFSDGLDEDVETLEREVELLQQSGVSALLTVALEGTRDPAQLQMVEFGRGFGNILPLRITTPSIGNNILKQIVTVSNRECCNVTCECWGPEGIRGSRGRPGSKGGPGRAGQPGFLGEDGVAGGRGPPGLDGLQGIRGCVGDRGQKGNRGVSGSRGEHGEDGLDGINGEQGVTGLDGPQGERGHPGKPGIPGIRGEAGLKGQRGLRGDPGETGTENTVPGARGEPGNPGLPGAPGPDGLPGESGVTGNPGLNGRPGSITEKGATGGPGDRGLPGSPGVSGPQGGRGGNGEPGPKGLAGFPGPQGAPGPAGDPGRAGRRGANGQKGQPGPPGVKGAAGSQGPRGAQGLDGRDGFGPPGPKGVKGDPGFPGYPGQMGEDGLPGTKGDPGRRGNQGRAGNSGVTGPSGVPGDHGYPGHRGPRGPPGSRAMTECEQVSFIRDHCVCSHGRSACPAYPTELVFGLDMSKDVTPAAFERQRSALLSLLEDISVAESNCPTGARVAVVGYSAYTKYLIRFQDYRRKKQLIESVKNIALERTSNGPNLGAAMRFTGQNVFKRVRAGAMMRKVAVFFANGPPQDISGVITAVMEYRAGNIVPAVISLRNAPALNQALEVDDSGKSIFVVLGRNAAADLRKVKNCAVCYDPCKRSEQCAFIQDVLRPQEADLDLAVVVDSSREVQADEYAGVQQLLGSVVEQLAVSPQPRRAGSRARVAVVQQSGTQVSKPEFGLQTYQTHDLMRKHLMENMQQQGGSSALGQTLDFTLNRVLLDDSQPRKRRALLAMVGTQTSDEDRAKLRYMSQKAKCEGVAMFVVTVGDRFSRTEVEELASLPVQQHLIHLGRPRAEEQGYAQRFFRVFLNVLNKGINSYPPPSLKRTCDQLRAQDGGRSSRNGRSSDGSEVRQNFQELVEGQTQLDLVDSGTRGDGQRSPPGANDACFLRKDAGGCQNYTVMWFFDSHQQKCSRFQYGGCGGNENRFKKKKDCERVCMTRVR